MKTGGGKNFSCFFNYFPKAKLKKRNSLRFGIYKMQKGMRYGAFFLQSTIFKCHIASFLLNRHRNQ